MPEDVGRREEDKMMQTPINHRPRPERASPFCARTASSPPRGGCRLATVLVVDDNPASRELARIMLVERARLQCQLECVQGGREALTRVAAIGRYDAEVDLVLLDINMPGLDGFEVLNALMRAAEKPIVVMCSTSLDQSDMQRAFAQGAAGYLEKPPRLENLRPLIAATRRLALQESDAGAILVRAA